MALMEKYCCPSVVRILKKTGVLPDKMGAFRNTDNKLLTLYFLKDEDMSSSEFQNYFEACTIVKNGFKNAIIDETIPVFVDDSHFKSYSHTIMKSWMTDCYAKGSYSTYSVNLQDKIDQKVIYKEIECKKIFLPIDEKIFFVGEHATLLDEIGTMEAAVESGERIAKMF